jgi:GT2 family glycosyltransferase
VSDHRAAGEVQAPDRGLAGEPSGTSPVPGASTMAPAGTTARPTVSVVVCGFTEDRWEDLRQAVNSLHEQVEPPREIILVVDHCPGLLRRAHEHLAGLTIVPNRRARGLAGARNTGGAEAHGDVVAFMDDDAAADPHWLARLADHYRDARVMGVGGFVRPAWETGRPPWFPPELDWVVGCSYLGLPVRSGPVRNFIGANMSFRREVMADLDGFSVGLGRIGTTPLGCEETEFCLRLSQRYPDGVLLYEPAASVEHRVREKRARWGYLWSRCYAEGLSKARVARLAGAGRALSSERSYVRSTVPRGIGRSLRTALQGRLAGLLSALALVSAIMVTGAGYLVGRAAVRPSEDRAAPAEGSRARRAWRWAGGSHLVPWAGLALSTLLWGVSLQQVDVAKVATAGLGLVPALPVTFWAALVVLTFSFCALVGRRVNGWPVMTGYLLALVLILHATPAILYGTLRYSWAWKHIGVIDYIAHNGIDFNLGGVLGAYQAWPGFFALNSFFTTAAGQGSALGYASWALPVNDLLWLGPIILIARAFTSDWRFIWTAAWLFELGNWVGQDYFSPQAFAFFLYLTVIAVCLRWLWDPRPPARPIRWPLARRKPGRWWGARSRRSAGPVPGLPRYGGADGETPPYGLPPALVTERVGGADSETPPYGLPPALVTERVGGADSETLPHGLPPVRVTDRAQGPNSKASPDGVLPGDVRPARDAFLVPRSTRIVLVMCLLPLMAAIASAHQLTPFMLVAALTLLAMFRQVRPRALPVIMAVITVGWILYAALPWLGANQSQIVAGLGLPWANTSAHLIGGAQVPFDQLIVRWAARLLSVVIAVLAVIGFFRFRRRHDGQDRRSWNRTVLLGLAALPAAAANNYGGEVIFRVFIFALPFMAITAAAAFFPHRRARRSGRAGVVLASVSLFLVGAFSVANYGQEAINYFTPQEVAAGHWLAHNAPKGAKIVAANSNYPWAFAHYEWYTYTFLDYPASVSRDTLRTPVQTVTGLMRTGYLPASYLVFTRSQAQEDTLTGVWRAGTADRVTRQLLASGKFRVVYRNADVIILQLAHPISPALNQCATVPGQPPALAERGQTLPGLGRCQ